MLKTIVFGAALLASAGAHAQLPDDLGEVQREMRLLCPYAEHPVRCREEFLGILKQYPNAAIMGSFMIDRLGQEYQRLRKKYAISI